MGDNTCIDVCEKKSGDLSSLSPAQISTLANILAILLSEGRSKDELNVLGNFIVSVGSLMLTIAAQEETQASKEQKKKQISDLKKQIKELENSL